MFGTQAEEAPLRDHIRDQDLRGGSFRSSSVPPTPGTSDLGQRPKHKSRQENGYEHGEHCNSKLGIENGEDEALLLRLLKLIDLGLDAHARVGILLHRYGTLERIVRVAQGDLCDDDVLTIGEVAILRTMQAVATNVLRVRAVAGTVCGSFEQLHAYLQLSLSYEQREVSRLIFLDSKNVIIKDEPHTTGTINFTPYFPREILKRSLVNNAAGVIIVHNHPSGDPSPSIEDILHTTKLRSLLAEVGVSLIDHVIVGRHRTLSLRKLDEAAFSGGPNER